jgi:prefoldin subunit 5
MPPDEDASAVWGGALMPAMMTIVERQLGKVNQQQQASSATTEQQWSQVEQARREVEQARREVDYFRHYVDAYRQQISGLERVLADQQMSIAQLHDQLGATHAHLVHVERRAQVQGDLYEAAIRDLTERSNWLDSQAQGLRQQLDAVRSGRVMRILNRLAGR